MSKAQLVKQALAKVVSKHGAYVDPFSSEQLDIMEHSHKIVVSVLYDQNVRARERRLAAIKGSMDDSEDALAPVFFEAAVRVFPSDFDFRLHRRVVVTGGPSCGKTTLLKHLAVLCATRQETSPGGQASAFVPLVLSVSDLTAFIEASELGADDDIVGAFYAAKFDAEPKRGSLVKSLLKSGRAWVLLDGLDEAVSDASLGVFIRYIHRLTAQSPKLRVVITTRLGVRETTHRNALRNLDFAITRMRPLTTDLAEAMLKSRLCGAPGSVLFARKDQLPDWLRAEIRRPRYNLFRKSPLTLLLLINVLLELDQDFGAQNTPRASALRLLTSSCEQKESAHSFHPRNALELDEETVGATGEAEVEDRDQDQDPPASVPVVFGLRRQGSSDRLRMPTSRADAVPLTTEEKQARDEAIEAHFKQSCPGYSLTTPYSRIDLFRRAIIRLLRWRPIDQTTKTTCRSPVNARAAHHPRSPAGAAKTVQFFPSSGSSGLTIEFPANVLKSFDEVDPNLLELLQALAYAAHERERTTLRQRDFEKAVEQCSDASGAELALRGLMTRIEADEAPMFAAEDRDDYVEEKTQEQRQHVRHRASHQRARAGIGLETCEPGVSVFLHLSLQEHLAAEYIANTLLSLIAGVKASGADAALTLTVEVPETGPSPPPERWSRRRSRSVVASDFGRRRYGATGAKTRRASVPDADLMDLSKLPSVQARIEACVEQLMIGHFEPASYRVNKAWWQPVILKAFDLLAEQEPAAVPGGSLFDVVLSSVVRSCQRLQRFDFGRVPEALESFWLATAAHGNVLVAQGLIRIVGIDMLLHATDEEQNNALHLAATNNQPDIIKILMAEDSVDADYLDRNNMHGWDPSNMAMIFNFAHCFRLLCWTDGDRVARMCRQSQRPEIVDAAMKGRLADVRRILREEEEEDDEDDGEVDQRGYGPYYVGKSDETRQQRSASSREAAAQARASENTFAAANRAAGSLSERTSGSDADKDVAGRERSSRRNQSTEASRRGQSPSGVRSSLSNLSSLARRRRRASQTRTPAIRARGSSGMTALMWAARNGHAAIVDELLKHGADLKLKAQNITALIFAIESGNYKCVERLLAAGADPTERTSDDDSSLLCACSFGFDGVAKLLISAGAEALEALVVSCVQGKTSTVRSLIDAGLVDVNTVWQDLMVTPLAGACVAGHLETILLLLALGADPNIPIDVEYGSTPLMLASHMGNTEVVRSLLNAGANVNAHAPPSSQCAAANGPNTTAVSLAIASDHAAVEMILRDHGGQQYVEMDLEFYEWLGGRVSYPDIDPDFAHRRRAGVSFETLLDEDVYLHRVDLSAWQFLGGRMRGEAAWEPRSEKDHKVDVL